MCTQQLALWCPCGGIHKLLRFRMSIFAGAAAANMGQRISGPVPMQLLRHLVCKVSLLLSMLSLQGSNC